MVLYRALKSAHGSPDAWATFVWQNKAPVHVKFFAWLLSQNRIQCKTALRKKGIVDNTICEICQAPEETAAHIILGCPNAKQFWNVMHSDFRRLAHSSDHASSADKQHSKKILQHFLASVLLAHLE
jgi:hypothetical protein